MYKNLENVKLLPTPYTIIEEGAQDFLVKMRKGGGGGGGVGHRGDSLWMVGGKHCFLLEMHGFCNSNNAQRIYNTSY